jgi:hypothetical protein
MKQTAETSTVSNEIYCFRSAAEINDKGNLALEVVAQATAHADRLKLFVKRRLKHYT